MAAPPHYLVSFENVSATVGGFDISSIVELQLTAAANGIPAVTLLVDAKSSAGGMPQVASAMSLAEAREILDTCRAMVKTSSGTLSLSVTARSVGAGGGDEQTLTLNGWLLTDVSLSPVRESGVATVSLTFMHPICRAHFGGIVPGLLAKVISFENLTGSDPLSVFIDALRIYGEEAERSQPRQVKAVPGAADTYEVRENLIHRLGQATSALEECLSWTGGGLPAESQLGAWGNLLRYGLTIYAMPSGGTSVYQRFANCLVPECSLAIGGDYTAQTLEVGPFRPWADATLSIADSDIVSLAFPSSDPSPLSGVRLTSNDTADTVPSSYHVDAGQVDVRPADIYYVPNSELAAEYLYGPIQQFQEPGWLSMAKSWMLIMSRKAQSDTKASKGKLLQTAVTTPRKGHATFLGYGAKLPSVDYSGAMLACAKAYYETSLMKDWSFQVNTRLLFDNGGILCPGRVVSVRSGEGEALAGYVTGVTHSISVAGRSAHTTLSCTHPRFGGLPAAITSDTNALYG